MSSRTKVAPRAKRRRVVPVVAQPIVQTVEYVPLKPTVSKTLRLTVGELRDMQQAPIERPNCAGCGMPIAQEDMEDKIVLNRRLNERVRRVKHTCQGCGITRIGRYRKVGLMWRLIGSVKKIAAAMA